MDINVRRPLMALKGGSIWKRKETQTDRSGFSRPSDRRRLSIPTMSPPFTARSAVTSPPEASACNRLTHLRIALPYWARCIVPLLVNFAGSLPFGIREGHDWWSLNTNRRAGR